jgi:hypothetical protein
MMNAEGAGYAQKKKGNVTNVSNAANIHKCFAKGPNRTCGGGT